MAYRSSTGRHTATMGLRESTFLFDVWEDLSHGGFRYSEEGKGGVRGGKKVVD